MIQNNNILIAKFMGAVEFDTYNGKTYIFKEEPDFTLIDEFVSYGSEELEYHSSWDWIIPVIDEITSKDEYFTYKDETASILAEGGFYINTKFITETYNQVVEFVKWFNKNKLI